MSKDYEKELEKYLPNNNSGIPQNTEFTSDNNSNNFNPINKNKYQRMSELEFFTFDISELPCGRFYPNGTMLKIRPAKVIEIQAYSMVDDNNIFDLIEKANDIIANCVRIELPNGELRSYLDLKDPDRFFLLFVIRDLTVQKGSALKSRIVCNCGHKNDIILDRTSFSYHEINDSLLEYYNDYTKTFDFELVNDVTYKLGVPTIGLQKSFYSYIVKNTKEKTVSDVSGSFLKLAPFTISDRTSITDAGIVKLAKDFEILDKVSFGFLNSFVESMSFGIKDIKTICGACGQEAYADFGFPEDKPSRLFNEEGGFKQFIKKK